MRLLPDLRQRAHQAELMDSPDCDAGRLARSHLQLAWINRYLARIDHLLDRFILDDGAPLRRTITIVEVGCGGGDVLARLARRARTGGLSVRLVGLDPDQRAAAQARGRLASTSEVEIRACTLEELTDVHADYVFCNHVLHHVAHADVPAFMAQMAARASRRILVNDLLRSPWAYAGYTLLAGILFHRSYTFHDGRLSIRRGFLPGELTAHAQNAGLRGARVFTLPPGRIVLVADGAAVHAAREGAVTTANASV